MTKPRRTFDPGASAIMAAGRRFESAEPYQYESDIISNVSLFVLGHVYESDIISKVLSLLLDHVSSPNGLSGCLRDLLLLSSLSPHSLGFKSPQCICYCLSLLIPLLFINPKDRPTLFRKCLGVTPACPPCLRQQSRPFQGRRISVTLPVTPLQRNYVHLTEY